MGFVKEILRTKDVIVNLKPERFFHNYILIT